MTARRMLVCLFCCAALIALAMVASAPATVLTQYDFDGDLQDSALFGANPDHLSATAAAGTLSTAYLPGVVGQAVRVSRSPGEATVLSAADSDDLDLTPSWTIEAFVKPDTVNTGQWDRFVTKWFDGSNQYHWTFKDANNGQDLFFNGVNQVPSSTTGTVPLDQWSHVAMTGDPVNGLRLWQDGAVVGSAAYVAPAGGTDAFRIGNWDATTGNAGSQFSGLVDELLIHNNSKDAAYMLTRTAMLPAPTPNSVVTQFSFENNLVDTAPGSTAPDNLAVQLGAGPLYFPGVVGSAVSLNQFPGDAVNLQALSTPDLNLAADWTIEMFAAPTDVTGWQRTLLKWSTSLEYHFAILDGALDLYVNDGALVNPIHGGAPKMASWNHLLITNDSSDATNGLKAYVNGVEVTGGGLPQVTVVPSAAPLDIGGSGNSLHYNGLIDEVLIHTAAVDQAYVDGRVALIDALPFDEGTFGFPALLAEKNDTTQGWFFTSDPAESIADVTLDGVTFKGNLVAAAADQSGANGVLSWSDAQGYDIDGFSWGGMPEQAARDALSIGGIWSGVDQDLSFDIDLAAGTPFIIELVSLQPNGIRRMDVSVDGALVMDEWTVIGGNPPGAYNKLLRFAGVSDGTIDLEFTGGSAGDMNPALSILTLTVVPEPSSAALALLALCGLAAVRRRR